VYERCRQLLAEELGAYPSPETEAIYRHLLEQDIDDGESVDIGEPLPPPSRRRRTFALAGEALGLAKPRLSARRRPLLLAALIVAAIGIAAGAVAAVLEKPTAPLFARPDSLARIDPATDKVTAVIDVGADPVVVAAGGRSVWVYNRNSGTISDVDAGTNRVVKTTAISGLVPVQCCSLFSGPVLAGDASGAWFVNGGEYTKPRLTHVPPGAGRKQQYSLDLTPTGVAAGEGAVWIVGRRGRDYQVVRIDPATGRVTARTPFPASSRIDSIAVGYGAVWVVSSSTATLTRIDPRSARRTGTVVVGSSRPTRPMILPYVHSVTVRLTDHGGTDTFIDPSTLTSLPYGGSYGPPDWGQYSGDLGALWWYDWPTGAVFRQETENGPSRTIHVTAAPPQAGGPCLTSMSAGSGSLWVAAAAGPSPNGGPCVQ
jgi:sugar lactone lactonase YvrE